MSRLGQLRALKKASDLLLIGGLSAARRGPLLAPVSHTCVIQIGKKHAFKKYDQFALYTSCFW